MIPLLETPEAVKIVDDIIKLDGLDEIFVGLNDLSLGYGKKFMFELLCDGTVEKLSDMDQFVPRLLQPFFCHQLLFIELFSRS